jgi:diguanylate cyclase (GGDEF)-like protein/PAS domain S-box-containing protein
VSFESAGGPALVEVVARPLTYGGRPATVLALRDLSGQRRAETALRDSEERLRLAVEATGLGIWDVDPPSGARRWSDEYRAILGLPPEARADPELFASLIHPADRAWVVDRYRRAYEPAGDGRYEAELRILRASDGAERWVQATGRVFFDGTGRPLRAVGTLADVTERRQAHEALRESEGRYRALVETSPDAVFVHRDGVIVFANAQAARLFGAGAPAELVGRSVFALVDEASLPAARARTAALAVAGARAGLAELTYRRLDGTPFPVEVAAAAVLVDGRLVVQVVFRDLTARKAAETELRRTHERLARHMDNTPLGVVELAHGAAEGGPWRVRAWSGQAEAIFGWTAAEATGRTPEDLALVHEGDHGKQALVHRDLLEEHRPRAVATLRCYTRDREIRHCRFHASLVRGSEDEPDTALLLVEDITEHLATQENIHRLAHHDGLTGLPNRVLFQDRLEQALARDRREGCRGALMLLDLDQFKEINDSLGHAAGDQLLRALAARLDEVVREADTLARLGGDEFALVQTALGEADQAGLLAQRIARALARPFPVEDQQLAVTASIGITLFPDDGTTAERLLRNADMALYQAKAAGRNRHAFYRVDMDRELQASRSLQQGLRKALEEDGLTLVYQPVFELPEGRLGKVEALLRWPHPGGGEVPPSTFIPIAESSGLIRP